MGKNINDHIIMRQIGAKLRTWRGWAGYTRKEFAAHAGLAVGTCASIEAGKNYSMYNLLKYINGLGNEKQTMKELFAFTDEDREEWRLSDHEYDEKKRNEPRECEDW